MATLKIDPIVVTTQGGFQATISGIDPSSTDCIKGHIKSDVRWDLLGRARDNHEDCNIDMQADEMRDLVDLAKRLGAPDA